MKSQHKIQSRQTRGNSQSGFSLIEVMIATALLGTMGGILVSMLWLTFDGQNAVRDTRNRLHAARVALNTISRELSMAFLSTHVDEEERRQTFFDGDSDQIDFTTLAHRRLAKDAKESDAVEIGYKLGKDRRYPNQSVLIRRQKTPIDDSPGKGGVEDVLAVGVRKLQFEYWDANDEDWDSDWEVDFEDLVDSKLKDAPTTMGDDENVEHKTMLPYRVRISLVVEDSDGDELSLETQAPIYMRRAFRFLQVAGTNSKKSSSAPRAPAPRSPRAIGGNR